MGCDTDKEKGLAMRRRSLLPLTPLFLLLACSGGATSSAPAAGGTLSSAGGSDSAAGNASTGGLSASGGSAVVAATTGGQLATGGSMPVASGGSDATGGSVALGGAKATGGAATSTVDTTAALGGSKATGGAAALGGTSSSTTGGKSNGGGNSAAGGTKAATGGAATAGGVSSTGGSAASGSCVESTCGSHKWPCWKMPNPTSSGLPNAASYTDLGNGAVRDNITCLVWEKSPDTTAVNGATNQARCDSLASSNYAGFTDWRLPTRVEMASIVNYTLNPGYPKALTRTSAYYRTVSNWYETITGQNTSGYAWIYGEDGFTSNAYAWTDTAIVRCVRGNGAGEGQNDFAKEPQNHYNIDPTAGETTDNYTGLVWQQDSSPATMAWSDAANYCATLNLNGHTWRVPSINELASIVNEALVGPAVNRTAFPNTHYGSKSNNWYWANAEFVGSTYGWAINYDDGFTGYNSGASGKWNYFTAAYVKCVR